VTARWLVGTSSFAVLMASACVASRHPETQRAETTEALEQLNRELLESVFIRQDPGLLADVALPNLVVVPPGGIVEDKTQVLSGIANVAMDSVRIDDVRISQHGVTAVITARVTRLGSTPSTNSAGRSRIMSVFVHDRNAWRLLARSITPCIERAIAAGRC
jgi:hypothetical protein